MREKNIWNYVFQEEQFPYSFYTKIWHHFRALPVKKEEHQFRGGSKRVFIYFLARRYKSCNYKEHGCCLYLVRCAQPPTKIGIFQFSKKIECLGFQHWYDDGIFFEDALQFYALFSQLKKGCNYFINIYYYLSTWARIVIQLMSQSWKKFKSISKYRAVLDDFS